MRNVYIKVLGSFSREEVDALGVDFSFSDRGDSIHDQIVAMGECLVDQISEEIYSDKSEYDFLKEFKNGQVELIDKSGAFLQVVVSLDKLVADKCKKEIILMAVDSQTSELI